MNKRPEKTEYGAYYERYVSLVGETDIVSALENQTGELENLFSTISAEKSLYAYAPGKWTIREMVGHLIDGEKIFAYRALRISRRDKTPLEGFEQDGYIENANFNSTAFKDLTDELLLARKSNFLMFRNMPETAWEIVGTASGVPVSVRGLAYIMVGHIRHHINILNEKYLN